MNTFLEMLENKQMMSEMYVLPMLFSFVFSSCLALPLWTFYIIVFLKYDWNGLPCID